MKRQRTITRKHDDPFCYSKLTFLIILLIHQLILHHVAGDQAVQTCKTTWRGFQNGILTWPSKLNWNNNSRNSEPTGSTGFEPSENLLSFLPTKEKILNIRSGSNSGNVVTNIPTSPLKRSFGLWLHSNNHVYQRIRHTCKTTLISLAPTSVQLYREFLGSTINDSNIRQCEPVLSSSLIRQGKNVIHTIPGSSLQDATVIQRAIGGRRRPYILSLTNESVTKSGRDVLALTYPNEPKTNFGPMTVLKTALAGGIAGAVGTTILYPFDAAKTLRQCNPGKYPSVIDALKHLLLSDQQKSDRFHSHIAVGRVLLGSKFRTTLNFARVYKGLWTSALGSIPSSALYFGAYETSKGIIRNRFRKMNYQNSLEMNEYNNKNDDEFSFGQRLLIHGCAAGSGNIISSAIFVPKELIKSKMQYFGGTLSLTRTIQSIVKEKGVGGLYCGYKAVLIRNIPTAALRFCLYEELRRLVTKSNSATDGPSSTFSWKLFVAGACSGALASGIMTPIDVIKTRLSTGFCLIENTSEIAGTASSIIGGGILGCAQTILRDNGWKALYAGAGSRIFFSAAFSGIGFATFEAAKKVLGVATVDNRVLEYNSIDTCNKGSSPSLLNQRPVDTT